MKYSNFWALFAGAICFGQAPLDITNCDNPGANPRKSVAVSTADAILIHLPTGAGAVVQFTFIGDAQATYKWRYRTAPTSPVIEGTGRVFENYDRQAQLDGTFLVTKRNKREDLLVQAGSVVLEWSHKDQETSWIYYCPDKASVTVLPGGLYQLNP